jgi:hypothetical protein
MKTFKLQNILCAVIVSVALSLTSGASQIFAHGGEDHGEAKPKTETTDKGTVSHTTRIGELEVLLKHERLSPDTGITARLFVTEYATNNGFNDVVPAIEIEAANGGVVSATIEKTDAAGSFTVKIPALAEGTYLIRAKLTHDGETDTATFSGVKVQNAPTDSAIGGDSWTRTGVTALLFLVGATLFGGLVYFAARAVKSEPLREETVSA